MKSLEQLKYDAVPLPAAKAKAPKTANLQVNGELLVDQFFQRKANQPFRPTMFYEREINEPNFAEMDPLQRAPYVPYDLRRDVHAAGASQLPLYLR